MGFNMWCFKSMILFYLKHITGFKYPAKTHPHVLHGIFIGFPKSMPEGVNFPFITPHPTPPHPRQLLDKDETVSK